MTAEVTVSAESSVSSGSAAEGQGAPKKVKRLPREVRERQILDAALTVFAASGYHAASMDEISDVAGVSKPMIYSYLGAKEELFVHSIRRESGRLLAALQHGVRQDRSPDMQLWHGLHSFYRFVADYRESWIVLHRHALMMGSPFADEVADMRGQAIKLVATLVVSAGSQRGFADQLEVSGEGLAAALVGAAESLADWWLDHPQVPVDALASWVMNLTWLGFSDMMRGEVWRPTAS